MSKVFWAKLYCKISDLFCWFLLVSRLSTWKSENSRQSSDMRFLIIYFPIQISLFGAALGHFSQCKFKIFCHQSTVVADVFTNGPVLRVNSWDYEAITGGSLSKKVF